MVGSWWAMSMAVKQKGAVVLVKWQGQRVLGHLQATVERNLDRAAEYLKTAVQKSMKAGGGKPLKSPSGRPYEYYNRARGGWVIASTPPAPPHVQTGKGRQTIFSRPSGKLEREVGTNLGYMVLHELTKRPFIRPTLKKKQATLARIIAGKA